MQTVNKLAIAGRPLMISARKERLCLAIVKSMPSLWCSSSSLVDGFSASVPARSTSSLRRRYATSSFAEHRMKATIPDTRDPCVLCNVRDLPNSQGTVATVSVSNHRKLNIVNTPLFVQLLKTFQKLAEDESLRAVVLTGAKTQTRAQAFIGGADITEMFSIDSPDQARDFITKIHDVCTAIRTLPVPVIARIDGFCLGAGLEIMAACDLRVATEQSVFGMPEVKVGIPSVVEARLLCDLVGWGRTRRLVYLAENIDAVTAEKWGLIESVVADTSRLDQTVDEWAKRIGDSGSRAIRAQKVLCKRWEEVSVDEGIEAGVECFAKSYEDGGKEPKKMMGAFVNRQR